jgi:3-hydroxybutyryl-CoA dehydrogenase
MKIRTVGVVGAGVMGTGLAQSLAQAGYRVVLVDVDEQILVQARHTLRSNLRLARMLSGGKPAGTVEETLALISMSTSHAGLSEADFVIENVTERWEVKRPVYEQLDAVCLPSCVFAANTSAISITRIGSVTRRPAQVLGMHFMNPVPMKKMVEVIRGYHTSDATIDTARALLAGMNKECVIVNDSPGFVSNRVLMLTINEAIFLVQDNVAPAADVDRLFRDCFGHKMGPLETADLIGLDTILMSLEVLQESFADPKFRPSPLLKRMVDAGLWGRKSGRGFYEHENAAAAATL